MCPRPHFPPFSLIFPHFAPSPPCFQTPNLWFGELVRSVAVRAGGLTCVRTRCRGVYKSSQFIAAKEVSVPDCQPNDWNVGFTRAVPSPGISTMYAYWAWHVQRYGHASRVRSAVARCALCP